MLKCLAEGEWKLMYARSGRQRAELNPEKARKLDELVSYVSAQRLFPRGFAR